MYYLEVKFSPRQSAKSKDFKIITSMVEAYHGVPSFLGMLPKKTWATQQTAERAINHFREWVDGGRRQQNAAMRAGASSEARAAAVCKLDAPQRFSGRLNLSSPSVAVSINFIEGRAQVKFAPRAPAQLSQEEHSALWQVRSRPMQQVLISRWRKRAALDVESALGEGAADAARSEHGQVLRVALKTIKKRKARRGKGRAALVSVNRARGYHHRLERLVGRQEQSSAKNEQIYKEAHAFRVGQIERVRTMLLNGDIHDLLDESGAEKGGLLSRAQTQRLTTQGWALVAFYMEADRLETAVRSGAAKVPTGGVMNAAAQVAAAIYGVNAEAVRCWEREYAKNGGTFAPDQRGKWARELLIHEEDLKLKFHKWMVRPPTNPPPSIPEPLPQPPPGLPPASSRPSRCVEAWSEAAPQKTRGSAAAGAKG